MHISLLKEIFLSKRKTWIIIAFVTLLNVLLAVYGAFIQQPQIAALQSEWIARRENSVDQMQVLNKTDVYKKAQADLQTLRSRIFPKRDFTRFLGELFDLAKRNSLTISSVTYKPAVIPQEQLLSYGIALTVAGKYPALKKFLNDLGNTSNLVVIDSVTLSNQKLTEEQVQLQVQLSSYFRVEGQ
jgi:type IV pilus assembly protein PilO